MATKKNPLSLNVQHDYITLRTPNGNFTTSWGGAKASGKLANNAVAFRKIDEYVQTEAKKEGANYGSIMESLTDPKILSALWPDWNAPVPVNDFKTGETVKFKAGSPFIKKYGKGGVVKSVARKNVFIQFETTSIGFDYQELEHT